jgi:hypothetical protein
MNNQRCEYLHRKSSVLAIAVSLALAGLSSLLNAQAQGVSVSGTWNLCGHNMWETFHQAGRNFTIDVYQNQVCFGPLLGTLFITPEDPEHDVVRLASDGVTLIRVHFHGRGTFGGSVLGTTLSAAAEMGYQGQIAPDGSGQASWWLDDPVTGIHGRGTFYGNPPSPNPCEGDGYYVDGTYTGQIQLSP